MNGTPDRAPTTRGATVRGPIDQPRLNSGWIASAAWTVLRRRAVGLLLVLGPLLLLAFMVAFGPLTLLFVLSMDTGSPDDLLISAALVFAALAAYGSLGLAGAAAALVVRSEVEQQPIAVGTAALTALGRAHVIVPVQLAFTLAYLVGTALLIVPGVLVALYGWCAVPAAAVVGVGPVAALRSSAEICGRDRSTSLAVVAIALGGFFGVYVVGQIVSTVGVLPMILAAGGGGGGGGGIGVGMIASIVVVLCFSILAQVIQFVGLLWLWLLAGAQHAAARPPVVFDDAAVATFD